jgi:hypothetical protein
MFPSMSSSGTLTLDGAMASFQWRVQNIQTKFSGRGPAVFFSPQFFFFVFTPLPPMKKRGHCISCCGTVSPKWRLVRMSSSVVWKCPHKRKQKKTFNSAHICNACFFSSLKKVVDPPASPEIFWW